jgi:hypothetical protein
VKHPMEGQPIRNEVVCFHRFTNKTINARIMIVVILIGVTIIITEQTEKLTSSVANLHV